MPGSKEINYKQLTALIEKRSQGILRRFGQALTSGVSHPELLIVLGNIKNYWKDMLRPSLTSFCCEAVGGQTEAVAEVSLMVTLIAAGMGVHDDIIDKSPNKHFRMTILGLHGPDETLVVGDLLIVKALTAIREIVKKNCTPQEIESVIGAYEASFVEMCEGEFMEISCRKNLDAELEYYKKVLWKFGSDVEVCAKLGAILGGGSELEVQALSEFGRRLGFLSRLASDVKDCLNLEGNLPQRLQHESVPLPILYTAKSSRERFSRIKLILEKNPIEPSDLGDLLKLCFEAEAFAYIHGIAKLNAREANHMLRLIKPSLARDALKCINKKALADVTIYCL